MKQDGHSEFNGDLDAELQSHLERRTEDLVRGGLDRDAARRQARLEFGGLERYKEEIRDDWRSHRLTGWLDQLARESRYALRRLRASPVFTLFAVASIALGVGVTSALYSTILSMFWKPLGVPDANRVLVVTSSGSYDGQFRSVLSRPDYLDLAAADTGLANVTVSAVFWQALVGSTTSDVLQGEAVSGNYFQTLGLQPYLGRLIQPADDNAAAPSVVVLSERLWRLRYASDPAIVGQTVRIGGTPFDVVGIAPASFDGLSRQLQIWTGIWVPLESSRRFQINGGVPADSTDRLRPQFTMLASTSNRSLADARGAVAGIGQRLDVTEPLTRPTGNGPVPLRRSWGVSTLAAVNAVPFTRIVPISAVIMTIVALVLVVACTNLANLVLARGASRQHELAVRRALGASRRRLIREHLIESTLIAAAGAVGAFLVMCVLFAWLSSVDIPGSAARLIRLEPQLNLPVLSLTAVSILISLAVFGLGPALQLTRDDTRSVLAAESGSTGLLRWRTRSRLITWQVAVSALLSVIAAVCVNVVASEAAHDSGIDVDRLALGVINFRLPPWDEPSARPAINSVLELAREQPDLEAAAFSSGLPFGTTFTPIASLTTTDKPFVAKGSNPWAYLLASTPSVFRVLGVGITRGRAFDERDMAGARPVAVLSEHTAQQVFGTADVVGREFQFKDYLNMLDRTTVFTATVIGVASDTDSESLFARRSGALYLPLAQHWEPTLMLIARTNRDPLPSVGPLKSLVARATPGLVLDTAGTGRQVITGVYLAIGLVAQLAAGLALLAIVLAMAGLYGVLSQVVARRTREMGLRIALGADARRIRGMVLRDGLRPVLIGIGVGLALGVLGRWVIRAAFRSPLGPTDVLIFALAAIPLLAAALLSCYLPARRAARVDPNVALRDL